MLYNIFLLDFEINKNKNKNNIAINFYHSSKYNSFNRNLLGVDNANNKMFFNNKNEKKLMFTFKKAK